MCLGSLASKIGYPTKLRELKKKLSNRKVLVHAYDTFYLPLLFLLDMHLKNTILKNKKRLLMSYFQSVAGVCKGDDVSVRVWGLGVKACFQTHPPIPQSWDFALIFLGSDKFVP